MAKGQMRSNKEARKPKATKPKKIRRPMTPPEAWPAGAAGGIPRTSYRVGTRCRAKIRSAATGAIRGARVPSTITAKTAGLDPCAG